MTPEPAFRLGVWLLFGGVMAMRLYFSQQVRQSRERLMPDREAVRREGRGMFAARVALFLLMAAWLVLYALQPPWIEMLSFSLPDWLRWAGFVLGLASLGWWTWTQSALGKHWSPQLQLRQDHRLVTEGPYAHTRHPLYTAMMGFGISLALLSASWPFVALAALVVAGAILRVPREERMMLQRFGEEYQAYMLRTGRFLPK